MDQKSVDINSSKSMGNYGNFPLVSASKVFDRGTPIAVISVTEGTATVTAKQNAENRTGDKDLPEWVSVVLPVGVHIVNLMDVTVDASLSTLTICYYGA